MRVDEGGRVMCRSNGFRGVRVRGKGGEGVRVLVRGVRGSDADYCVKK